MHVDSILFDLDGTLWDAVDGILLTWNQVIARHPGVRMPISREEQESVMGLQMDEISRRLFPNISPNQQASLMQECMDEENEYLRKHGGTLYQYVEETLAALHRTLQLYIVSNCQSGYIEAFLSAHALEEYFDGYTCFGDTGMGKDENIKIIANTYQLTNPVYVGDTQGDLEAARHAGIPFLFAEYGFGSVENYDYRIHTFDELIQLSGGECDIL